MKWTDEKLTEGAGGGKFLRLKEGQTTIRIISEAEVIAKHSKDYHYMVCQGTEKQCQGCQDGDKASPKWLCYAIDRADQAIKQAELPYTVVKVIQALAKTAEYGFEGLIPFDIIITRTGQGLQTEYSLIPARKDTPLTEKEKEAIMALEPINIIAEKMKKRRVIIDSEPEETTELEPD